MKKDLANSPVKEWMNKHSSTFKKYNKFVTEQSWVAGENVEAEYETHLGIVKIVIDRLKYFTNTYESFRSLKYVKNFVDLMMTSIRTFQDQCNIYIETNDWTELEAGKPQLKEIDFQAKILSNLNKIEDSLVKLDVYGDEDKFEQLPIHSDKKIPFLMAGMLEEKFSSIKKFSESVRKELGTSDLNFQATTENPLSVLSSTEMFINMKSVPEYDNSKHYFEQSKDVIQFYQEELYKLRNGITIAGVYINPWLYWHINYFKTSIPADVLIGTKAWKPGRNVIVTQPLLRDNEIYVTQSYEEAKAQNLGLFLFGSRRIAKMQRNTDLLFYADGVKRPIGDAKVGDRIIGGDGLPTNITGVFPQGTVKLYEITLADGRTVTSGLEHLWKVFDRQAGRWKTLPLMEILNSRWKYQRTRDGKTHDVLNFAIPVNGTIHYEVKETPKIDPYFFGLWLGDGTSKTSGITTVDQPIIDFIYSIAEEYGLHVRKDDITYFIAGERGKGNPILKVLQEMNVIHNKHIPEECFLWSVEDRLQLLRGLMDSDGTPSPVKAFTQEASSGILDGFIRLTRELGIKITDSGEKTSNYVKKNGEYAKYVTISLYTGLRVFNLERKHSKTIAADANRKIVYRRDKVNIQDIRPIEDAEATCIMIDNDSHLYLTEDCIVTHNTVLEASYLSFVQSTQEMAESYVFGGSTEDLNKLALTLETGFSNLHPAWELPRNKSDWSDHIEFGLRMKNNRKIPYGNIFITNINDRKKNEKGAGGSVSGAWLYDEAGKSSSVVELWLTSLPSFQTSTGWSCTPILAGCFVKDTKVFDAFGRVINVQDFDFDRGTLGYDTNYKEVVVEDITHINHPSEKECLEIETKSGVVIGCSTDHPFLIQGEFVEAKDLKVGMSLESPYQIKSSITLGNAIDRLSLVSGYIINSDDEHLDPDRKKFVKSFRYNYETSGKKDSTKIAFIEGAMLGLISRTKETLHLFEIEFVNYDDASAAKLMFQTLGIHGTIENKNILKFNEYNTAKCYHLVTNKKLKSRVSIGFEGAQFLENLDTYVEQYKYELRNVEMFYDEIAAIRDIGKQEIYNITTGGTHTYLAEGMITHNTGGNDVLSQGARTMLLNPEAYSILPFNSDLLTQHIEERDLVTWDSKATFGTFLPAQMSAQAGLTKDRTNLSEWLKIEDEDLKKIEIRVTNWERAKETLLAQRELVKKIPGMLQKEKSYKPMSIPDCFITSSGSSLFESELMLQYSMFLEERGMQGRSYELVRADNHQGCKAVLSDKPIADFPFAGGNIDAGVLILEHPDLGVDGSVPDYVYTAGYDGYRTENSDNRKKSSLGAMYIYKRYTGIGNGEFDNTFVASYVSRPHGDMKTFLTQCELLLSYYNATCLPEAVDSYPLYSHLKSMGLDHIRLVEGTPLVKALINPHAQKTSNKYGLSTSDLNQQYLYGSFAEYVNTPLENVSLGFIGLREATQSSDKVAEKTEEDKDNTSVRVISEEEERQVVIGGFRIKDLALVKEIVQHSAKLNLDRIIASSHALALANYYDEINLQPRRKKTQASEDYRKSKKRFRRNGYGVSNRKIDRLKRGY